MDQHHCNSFVVFKTEFLRNTGPFQSRLPSHRVLALLLLAFPVVEWLEFLKILLASLVFLVGALSNFLLIANDSPWKGKKTICNQKN